MISEEKYQEFIRRREIEKEEWTKFHALPEAQQQASMFVSWVSLCGISTPKDAPDHYYYWCPQCNKWEELTFPCGLKIGECIEILREEIPRHAQERTSPAHKKIKDELRKKYGDY